MGVQPVNSPRVVPMDIAVGMLKGTSGYGAGQVIYQGWRDRSINHYPAFSRSLNEGATWTLVDGGSNLNTKGRKLQVDPSDQSIVYAVEGQVQDAAGQLWKYTNHGGAGAQVAAFGSVTRAAVCKVSQAATMIAAASTVLKTSADGGASVTSISVDGNIAGGGMALNWDWSKLMAIHSAVNGQNGTRYFQISPDGGITWFNKHGNMAGNFNGLIHVGFSLDN